MPLNTVPGPTCNGAALKIDPIGTVAQPHAVVAEDRGMSTYDRLRCRAARALMSAAQKMHAAASEEERFRRFDGEDAGKAKRLCAEGLEDAARELAHPFREGEHW